MRKKIILVLLISVLILTLLLSGAGVGGYWYIFQRPLPETSGVLQVPGVKGRVEVIRDRWGVPHIYADLVDDLFFAQGYVTAGDRLAQMELQRRLGNGRLAEVAGPAALQTDRFMRTLGLRRVVEAEWELLQKDPATHDTRYQDTARILTAYTAGVNAYIHTHRDRLPLEFLILGIGPEPWTPADSLVWGKVMALGLCANFEYEIARAALIERLGAGKAAELVPAYPADAPLIVPDAVSYRGLDGAAFAPSRSLWQVFGGPGAGSNNWVVSGARTASGKPLLANDPHMSIQMPPLWYLVHLHGPGFDVIGGSLPGAPGVILGHNARIAWGATNTMADVQDLYIEHLSPDLQQYEFRGQWYDVQTITETIRVRDAAPQTLPIAYTRHGPIISGVVPGVTATLALRWTALDSTATMLPAVLALDRASNWDEFRAALRLFSAPSQNFIYADVTGNIGYQMPGRIPVRAKGQGAVPAPGWTGEYEWEGFIPFDDLPRRYNPPEGYIVTANNRIASDKYPYLLANEYDLGDRARRIQALVTERKGLTARDFQIIQGDVLSLSADRIVPPLLRITPQNVVQQEALAALENWDRRVTTDSRGACVFEVWRQHLIRHTFGDELGDLIGLYLETPHAINVLERLLSEPNSQWFDDTRTPERETWPEIARRSLQDTLKELESRLGANAAGWTWGRLHTATFANQVAVIDPLKAILNRGPVSTPGDILTVNVGPYGRQYQQTTLPAYRQIVDLAEWREGWMVQTVGQSGHPASPHYDDLLPLWAAGCYAPMLFNREDVLANAEATLVLIP